MKTVIEVRNVHKWFGDHKVLNGVNLEVREGETLVIMGGSGGGKSTLLRILIGLLRPDEGQVLILGKDIARASEDVKDEVRKKFGMLFQGAALFNSLTVGENVALALREHTKLDDAIINIIVKVKLELVGLTGFEHHMPYEISGGMKKRVALARAIAMDPGIVFYDEPGAGLDPITSSVIDQLIMDLTKRLKMTSIVVTHEMTSAFRIADRMVVMHKGEIIANGHPDEIKQSQHPYVQQFIHGEIDDAVLNEESRNKYLQSIFGYQDQD